MRFFIVGCTWDMGSGVSVLVWMVAYMEHITSTRCLTLSFASAPRWLVLDIGKRPGTNILKNGHSCTLHEDVFYLEGNVGFILLATAMEGAAVQEA